METYLTLIRDKLKETLQNNNFIGKLEVEVNIKDGSICNMNIGVRESVKV